MTRRDPRPALLSGETAALLRRVGADQLGEWRAGFAANVATIAALAGAQGVTLFSDALNHASLIDGCRMATRQGAVLRVFRHRDYAHLRELLQNEERGGGARRALVVTDGVFSMDGDIADIEVRMRLCFRTCSQAALRQGVLVRVGTAHSALHYCAARARSLQSLHELKQQFGFLLLVDDAHGTLVVGAHGGGTAEGARCGAAVDVHTGTLSKSLGGLGGFVAGSRALKRLLVNTARGYIYSTALPAPCVAASLAALDVFMRCAALLQQRRARPLVGT